MDLGFWSRLLFIKFTDLLPQLSYSLEPSCLGVVPPHSLLTFVCQLTVETSSRLIWWKYCFPKCKFSRQEPACALGSVLKTSFRAKGWFCG
ncbi:rCG30449, isoform CRA_b [Rattus norvegicus]|uniref:RCG30449, isoform CRA_b n=1 Tax=Rattus norvegicus TaxID=10116 RepID=A6JFL3_RAT|nr:rCG30449, isoform CRA_b [Rattus norvegicus]EDM11611.1 rCG30449, isoform CRA_b [Rattus norvegicus]